MKRFEVYKNIRKRAMIFGLPISLFAIMMTAVVASLMVIIFSFSFPMIIGVFVFNAALYTALTRITNHSQLFQLTRVFPKIISNKKTTVLDYE